MSQIAKTSSSPSAYVRRLAVAMGVFCCFWITQVQADETQEPTASDPVAVKEWIKQLSAPSYVERKQAFLKLCDPSFNIDEWAKSAELADDPQLGAMIVWLKLIRSLPGSIDTRLEAVCDYPALARGSIEIVERYGREGKIELLLAMVRLIPKSSRDLILQNTFTRGESSLDHVFKGAWAIRKPELIPQFLDAMLPVHPVRIGLNRRWSKLGLGESWRLDVPLDSTDMQLAALESEGQIDQAVRLAKQTTQPGTVEKILLRNGRWNQWLELDPSRLSLVSAAWSEIPRVVILEALDRHEEAQKFYEVRKASASKTNDQSVLGTQLALITRDIDTVFANLKANEPNQLMSMYFFHNRIDDLIESEGLQVRTQANLSSWLDRNVVEGKGFVKATRFQALFRRIGEPKWSNAIQERIVKFIDTHPRNEQVLFWKDYLQQVMRYGLEDKRAELLALAVPKLDLEPQTKRRSSTAVAGFPEAQAEREMTIEDLFRASFPYMQEASYPLYQALKLDHPKQTDLELLEWLQLLHQGVVPDGWTLADVRKVFHKAISQRTLDGVSTTGSVIDLAEALDAMGAARDATEILESAGGVLRADLMRSRFLRNMGKYQQARSLALECLERETGSLEVFQWTSELLAQINDYPSLERLEHRVLTRPNGMEDFAKYSQEMRRGERFELPESIGRFLEIQYDSFPSSLGNRWLEDIYWGWNLSQLANHYHQTAPDYPGRVDKNFDLTLTSCLFDIFNEFDSPSGMNARLARGRNAVGWDLDWTQWAWRYERVLASGFWKAVRKGDRAQADRFLRAAHQIQPEQINTLIDAVPWVLEKFGTETLEEWFRVYYQPMQEHLKKYPEDTLTANNSAWLAVKCGFEFERALELAQMVTERQRNDTYLDTLAEAYFVKGDVDKAIEISLECHKLNPRDPHHRRQIKRYNESKKSIR